MRVITNLSPPRVSRPQNTSLDLQDPGQTSVDQDKGLSLTNDKIGLRALISQQQLKPGSSRPATGIHAKIGGKDSLENGKNQFFKDVNDLFKWRENNIVNYHQRHNTYGHSFDMSHIDIDVTKVNNWVSTGKLATDRKKDAQDQSTRPTLKRPQSSVLLKSQNHWEARQGVYTKRNKFSPAKYPASTTKPQEGAKSRVK